MAVSKKKNTLSAMKQLMMIMDQHDDSALIIFCKNGNERRFWHAWAERKKYKHHIPIRTRHFKKVYVYHCGHCNRTLYDDNVSHYSCCGGQCPDMGFYVCSLCGNTWYLDEESNSYPYKEQIKKRVGFNAIYITNSNLPRFAKGITTKSKSHRNMKPENESFSITLNDIKKIRYEVINKDNY